MIIVVETFVVTKLVLGVTPLLPANDKRVAMLISQGAGTQVLITTVASAVANQGIWMGNSERSPVYIGDQLAPLAKRQWFCNQQAGGGQSFTIFEFLDTEAGIVYADWPSKSTSVSRVDGHGAIGQRSETPVLALSGSANESLFNQLWSSRSAGPGNNDPSRDTAAQTFKGRAWRFDNDGH